MDTHTASAPRTMRDTIRRPRPQQRGVRVVARNVPQVVVQVVQQGDAVSAAVADQRIGGINGSRTA